MAKVKRGNGYVQNVLVCEEILKPCISGFLMDLKMSSCKNVLVPEDLALGQMLSGEGIEDK